MNVLTIQEIKEIKKCKDNILYFANKYVYIQDKEKGVIKYKAFPFQEDMLKGFTKDKKNLIFKSRQMGLSWIALIFVLWKILFYFDINVLILSKKGDDSKALLKRLRFMYSYLPDFLKGELGTNNSTTFELSDTRSTVESVAMSEDVGRSRTPNIVIWDEMAFPRDGVSTDEVWKSIRPALENGTFIGISTPNGYGNLFHRKWVAAEQEGYVKYMIHWSARPDRCKNKELFKELEKRRRQGLRPTEEQMELLKKEEWYITQRKDYSDDDWQQEYELTFLQSGNPIFDLTIVMKMFENVIEPLWIENNYVKIYEEPTAGEDYIATMDPAEGVNNDNSAFGIFTKTGRQVLEFATNKLPVEVFTRLAIDLCRRYFDAYLIIERNNHGHLALHIASEEQAYFNIYYSISDGKMGWHTNPVSKPNMIADLSDAIRSESLIIRSEETLEELRVFQRNGRKMEAPIGYKDDRVIMTALFLQALKNYGGLVGYSNDRGGL